MEIHGTADEVVHYEEDQNDLQWHGLYWGAYYAIENEIGDWAEWFKLEQLQLTKIPKHGI